MASSKRLISAVSALPKSSPTPYVCSSCRSTLPSTSRQQLRHNSDLPFTEKVRRKIWGTDNPPGLKDPYGGPSFLERRLAERKARQQQGQQPDDAEPAASQLRPSEPATSEPQPQPQLELRSRFESTPAPTARDRVSPEQDQEYVPATTWDNLEWLGHRGEYEYMEPTKADEYAPWLAFGSKSKPVKLTEPQLLDALHESIFDAVQPAEEDYDREAAIQVTSEGYVARAEEGVSGDPDAFQTAKLDFENPAANTLKIVKNFQLVTGTRIPDPTLNKLSQNPNATFRDLIEEILQSQKEKPKTTHESLLDATDLMAQGNVKVAKRRVTPVDKEVQVGRWKEIEKVLWEKGLPILGSQPMQHGEFRPVKRRSGPWVKKPLV